MRHVVLNADGEMIFWLFGFQFVEHGLHHRGSEFLRGKAVASADDPRPNALGPVFFRKLGKQGDDIHVQRLSRASWLLGAIENADRADCFRQGGKKSIRGKRAEQAQLQQADFLPAIVQSRDRFLDGSRAGAHQDDDALRVRRAHVIAQVVRAPGAGGKTIHRVLNDGRRGNIKRIRGFARLKKHIGILRAAPQFRAVRRERALAMPANGVFVEHGMQVFIGERKNLVHFVGRPEAVEKMQKRDSCLERCGVGDQREIARFLYGTGTEHGESGRARRHHVAVIAKDRERVRGNRSRGHVDHRGRQFSGDLIHIRDHQQKALRRGERRAERSGLQRAMQRAGRAAFALHFDDRGDRAKDVAAAFIFPLVRPFAHGGGRSDRIDGDHFARAIGNRCGSLISVKYFHRLWHGQSPHRVKRMIDACEM